MLGTNQTLLRIIQIYKKLFELFYMKLTCFFVRFKLVIFILYFRKIVENSIKKLKEKLAVAGDDAEIFLSSLCWLEEIIVFVSEWEDSNFNDWKTKSTLSLIHI